MPSCHLAATLARLLMTAALAVGLSSCAVAPPKSAAAPLQVDATRLGQVADWLKADVAKDRYPGAVVLVAQDGKVLLHQAVGWADKARNVPMTVDSIHAIASSTKLVTTVAALRLIEQNRLRVRTVFQVQRAVMERIAEDRPDELRLRMA